MNNGYDFDNRRKYERLNYYLPLIIKNANNYEVVTTGRTKNISVNGLGLESVKMLNSDNEYIFEFTADNVKQVLNIFGKVLWTYNSETGPLHGVEFKRMGFFKKLKLKNILKTIIK